MKIRPYRIYATSQQSKVAHSVSAVLASWASDWMIAGHTSVETDVTSLSDCMHTDINWLLCQVKDEPLLAIGCEARWLSQLRTLLLGDSIDASQTVAAEAMMQELSYAALLDLSERIMRTTSLSLRQGIELKPGPMPHILDQPGSADIALQVRIPHETTMRLLLTAEIIDALLGQHTIPAMAPVTPMLRALDDERVVLEAVVGEGELTLDELRTLAAGDVIPLRRRVNQEIVLQIDHATPVCGGFLGNAHGRLAVQLKSQ